MGKYYHPGLASCGPHNAKHFRMVHLYPKIIVKGQSFAHVKKVVVPNQSMTLKQIINRFIKHEALPVHQEGTYFDGEHDLEKLATEDITVKHEVLVDQKAKVEMLKQNLDKQEKSAMAKAKADKKAEQDELFNKFKDQKQTDPHPTNP